MDWLAGLIDYLPTDAISNGISNLTIWWSRLVENVPPDMLPMYAYVGFSVLVLLLWLILVRVLPSPIGGVSWLAAFAVLLTPGTASGDSGEIAPASIGVVYGILMKDPKLALQSLLPILVVFTVGLVIGLIWQIIKNIIESNLEKTRNQAITDEQANLQLASANYVDLVRGEGHKTPEAELI